MSRLFLSRDIEDGNGRPGVPPLSSSCGGQGAKSALDWARRKGFRKIVTLLQDYVPVELGKHDDHGAPAGPRHRQ
jgi:hypothetical protein